MKVIFYEAICARGLSKTITGRRFILIGMIAILSLVILSACDRIVEVDIEVGVHQFWLSEPPNTDIVETAIWELATDGGLDFDTGEFIFSVSPSGNNILVANFNLDVNLQNRRPGNMFGMEAEHISLYAKENGRFVRTGRIYIDIAGGYTWNDVVISGDETGIAWSEDETRLLFSAGKTTPHPVDIMSGFSSVFLVDFNEQFVEDLTGGHFEPVGLSEGGHSDYLPQWLDNDNISFIRYESNAAGLFMTSLLSMNLHTGSQEVLANLSTGCPLSFVSAYAIHGDYVYFSTFGGDKQKTGFLSAELTGTERAPTLLISFMELLEDYYRSRGNFFTSAEVSLDGRWALLTIRDPRVLMRDIPLVDCPHNPQSDPSLAMSMTTGLPWTPYHNVILFDLHSSTMVDPFINSALKPTEVIVTAATFAPDGKSLLCTVFGDSDMWTIASFEETSLWQVSLADDSFEAIRVFRTEVDEYSSSMAITAISWLDNNVLWIRPTWMERPFLTTHRLIIPAAFERLNDN